MRFLWQYLLIVLCSSLYFSTVLALEKPRLMLAKKYYAGINVEAYWVSEKLDGVRARWDGKQLISRGGGIFNAPKWFIKGFPQHHVLDGELWMARGKYQQTMSVVRQKKAHIGWQEIQFKVFDLPQHGGVFSERVAAMRYLIAHTKAKYLSIIPQQRLKTKTALMALLTDIHHAGGEGLMLHHQSAYYHSGRSSDLLKLKIFSDSEARVIAYRAGKGKFLGKMGAIKVLMNDKSFFIGSGFTDEQRANPPKIGSIVTFRYQGFTQAGIPRFATFLRVKESIQSY